MRLDRPYCESDIFKQLVLDNATATAAECRETIAQRLRTCENGICPKCVSPCNYPVARVVGSVLKCLDAKRHAGFVHYYQTSDAGQLARSMHGAIRKTGFGPVPERLASHLYHIGHNNPKGYLQRDSISCRRTNRNSPSAHFAPGFDGDGMPMARTGFHVPCQTQADCMACGRHPLTGQVRDVCHELMTHPT